MFIKDATYRSVPTADLTFPIAEGTVVTVGNVTGIVDQNLKEAAPTARIYVAVGGTIDLTSDANKNVTFSDEDISRLGQDFNFIPGAEGGGGSSLPEYTSSDVGKVLTLGEDAEHSTETQIVFLTEQRVVMGSMNQNDPYSMNYGTLATPPDFTLIGAGDVDNLYVVVDGTTYHVTAENLTFWGDCLVVWESTDVPLYIFNESKFGQKNIGLALTVVSAHILKTIPAVAPVWQAGGGGGIFPVTIGGTPPETLTSNKTYAEIVAAITDGLLPVAFAGGGSVIIPCVGYNASAVIFNKVAAGVAGNAIPSISAQMLTVASDNSVTMASAVRNFS